MVCKVQKLPGSSLGYIIKPQNTVRQRNAESAKPIHQAPTHLGSSGPISTLQ